MAWFDGYTPGMSRVNQSYWKDNNYSLNLYTDYFKQIGDHYFKVMGGFNAELYKRTNLSGQRDELITPDVPTLNTGTTEQKANGGYSHWANAGFFAMTDLPVSSETNVGASSHHSLPVGMFLANPSGEIWNTL